MERNAARDAPDRELAEPSALAVTVAGLYAERFGPPVEARFALMKLAEETGEPTGARLRTRGAGSGTATGDDPAGAIADVRGFLLVVSAREGIDPAAALRRKWGGYL